MDWKLAALFLATPFDEIFSNLSIKKGTGVDYFNKKFQNIWFSSFREQCAASLRIWKNVCPLPRAVIMIYAKLEQVRFFLLKAGWKLHWGHKILILKGV